MALTPLQSANSTADATTYTFSTQNLGTTSSDRYIIVSVHGRKAGASTTISSVTVGGVSASVVGQVTNFISNTDVVGLFIALVPTGATGDVVVTFGAGMVRAAIGMWAATGIPSATASQVLTSTATPSPSGNLDIPANGFAIAAGVNGSSGLTTWTGLTEKFDASVPDTGNMVYTGASDEFVSAQSGLTITAAFNASFATECAGVFASWAYGAAGSPAPRRNSLPLLGVGGC